MDFRKIMTAFRQHGFGNCTSIGVVKAAIEVYGMDEQNGVFAVAPDPCGKIVTLRDGTVVRLLSAELDTAIQLCGFQTLNAGDAEKAAVTAYAQLCFAVICKRKQMMEKYATFREAVDDVNDGESAFEAPEFLGLQAKVVRISYDDVFGCGGVVAHSPRHTVYVSHGHFDDYGAANKLDAIWEWARFARGIYRFSA